MNDQPPVTPKRGATHYRVGDLLIDIGRQQITRGGDLIALPKLSYDMLIVLVQEAPNLVSNDTFMERVWPRLVVSPETISQRVKLLRDALGDDPRSPRYIEGLRGRGYRLVSAVESDPAPATPASLIAAPVAAPIDVPPPAYVPPLAESAPTLVPEANSSTMTSVPVPERPPRLRRWWLPGTGVAALVLIVTGVGLYAAKRLKPASTPTSVEVVAVQPRTVAVLPFENLSTEPGNDFIALGVAETVLNRLGSIHDLLVTARSSSFALGSAAQDAREAGRRLGVRYLVEGSVQRAGKRLRVNAALVDAESNKEVWSLSFDRTIDDVFAVQDEIAARVSEKLAVSMQGPVAEYAKYGTQAYLEFLQGRAVLDSRKLSDQEAAIRHFTRALELAPNFATAMSDLAYAESALASLRGDYNREAPTLTPKLRALADRAIELEPSAGEAYYLRASLRLPVSGTADSQSLAAAEADYRKGFALDPNFALGVSEYGSFLYDQGRFDEALTLLDRATLLNPLAPSTHYMKGLVLRSMKGTFDEAVAAFEQTLAVAPDYYPAFTRLAQMRVHQGRLAEAIKLAEKALAVEPKADWYRTVLHWMYIDIGDLEAARDIQGGFQQSARALVATSLLCYRTGHLEQAELALTRAIRDPDADAGGYEFFFASQAVVERGIALHDAPRARQFLLAIPGLVKDHGQMALVEDNQDFLMQWAELERYAGDKKLATDLAQRVLGIFDRAGELAGFPGENDLDRASLLALLDRNDEAMASLESAYRTGTRVHWWTTQLTDSSFSALRATPRFQALVASTRVWLADQKQQLEQMRQRGEVPRRSVAAVAGGC